MWPLTRLGPLGRATSCQRCWAISTGGCGDGIGRLGVYLGDFGAKGLLDLHLGVGLLRWMTALLRRGMGVGPCGLAPLLHVWARGDRLQCEARELWQEVGCVPSHGFFKFSNPAWPLRPRILVAGACAGLGIGASLCRPHRRDLCWMLGQRGLRLPRADDCRSVVVLLPGLGMLDPLARC